MTPPRSNDAPILALILALLPCVTIPAAPACASTGPARVALFIDAIPHTDPIPTVFDAFLSPDRALIDLLDLDALAPQLAGGPGLAQALRAETHISAADFRFNRNGIQGRLRFLADPDPFLAYDLTLTNTTDHSVSLFFLFDLPTQTLTSTVSVASQLIAAVSGDPADAPAVLTYQQLILLGLADGSSLATPFRISTAAVPDLPIFQTIPSNPIPTASPVTAIALQSNLTLTPGDTATLTGHLQASSAQFPPIAAGDIQLLLRNAVIPEPSSASLFIVALTLLNRRW